MMRKSIGLIALVMVAMAFVVAPAAAEVVTMGVEIGGCDNEAPIVKCKWEQDDPEDLETGDIPHDEFEPAERNSWFKPTCNEPKTVKICAVVNDDDTVADIDTVSYSVTGPCGKTWSGCMCPCGDLGMVQAADEAKLITYSYNDEAGMDFNLSEIEYEFTACADDVCLFCAEIEIGYCDPAGEYVVEVWAKDKAGLDSNIVTNNFTMLRLCCCKFDFDTLTWDKMKTDEKEYISGDDSMTTPLRPSVENQGNVPAKLKVKGSALEDAGGIKWILNNCDPAEYYYKYDARINRDGFNYVNYFPEAATYKKLNGFVERCDIEPLCFSLEILNAMDPGTYTGTMDIVCYDDTNLDPCLTYTAV